MGVAKIAAALFAAVYTIDRPEDVAVNHVDLIEINHFYDEQGRLVFDQVIFYDWCDTQCRYNVCAWRLLKKKSQMPRKNYQTGDYEAAWHDNGMLRKVQAKIARETWTQYDPELMEREYLPKDQRRELHVLTARKPDRR